MVSNLPQTQFKSNLPAHTSGQLPIGLRLEWSKENKRKIDSVRHAWIHRHSPLWCSAKFEFKSKSNVLLLVFRWIDGANETIFINRFLLGREIAYGARFDWRTNWQEPVPFSRWTQLAAVNFDLIEFIASSKDDRLMETINQEDSHDSRFNSPHATLLFVKIHWNLTWISRMTKIPSWNPRNPQNRSTKTPQRLKWNVWNNPSNIFR